MSRSLRLRRARTVEMLMKAVTGACLLGTGLVIVAIFGAILWRGLPAITPEFLFSMPREQMTAGGIWPAIVGTFWLVFGTAMLAVPIGVATGVYLAEYARPGVSTRVIRLSIANMAGIPSIVYGLFGLSLFVIVMQFNRSLIAGSLTLACLTLPIIITSTEEALRQVPKDLRQASLALGATRLRTIVKVVLPAAAPGIVTGSILGLSRAAGETAPILVTAAAFAAPLPRSPLDPVMALPYHLFIMATQAVKPAQNVVWGTALVLVASVALVGMAAAAWRTRQRRKIRW